jgi:hypothetical protein
MCLQNNSPLYLNLWQAPFGIAVNCDYLVSLSSFQKVQSPFSDSEGGYKYIG